MNLYDYIIIGSGLFGATIAHKLHQTGKRVLVLEKRLHLGGNVYSESIEGINVHKYGAHIFHTSNKEVWDFVNSIVPFNRYTNCPVANFKGELYNLPFNMNTFHQMWGVITPEQAKAKIEDVEAVQKIDLDKTGKKQGRGAYICYDRECLEKVIKGKKLDKEFDVSISEDIYENLRRDFDSDK